MSALPPYIDMALEGYAQAEFELRERVASLEADVASYREVAQQGIHALHHVTRDRDRLARENIRLRDLLRVQRAA